ncbi:hypothetical protein IPdc08_00828 [archaeon]|nr:hypothetical protein IPdc08_00828 [archaeon]
MKDILLRKLRYELTLAQRKSTLKILILCPYSPLEAKERLKDIKGYLGSRGYTNTKLVEDFSPGKELTDKEIFLKSRDKINNWADILFFFFLKEALNESKLMGVQDEVTIVCEDADKVSKSVIFIDDKIKTEISKQFKGRLKNYEFKLVSPSSQVDTKKAAFTYAFKFLKELLR